MHVAKESKCQSGATILLLIIILMTTTFLAAEYIGHHQNMQDVIATLGYPGIFLIATVASFNTIAVPAASLVPIFTTAGLYLPLIIVALAFGTFTADCINFVFGNWSSIIVANKYPFTYTRMQKLYTDHTLLVLPLVFFYAAFVPLSNQLIILPLAALGMPFRQLFPTLLMGAFVNQGLLAFGTQTLFTWFIS